MTLLQRTVLAETETGIYRFGVKTLVLLFTAWPYYSFTDITVSLDKILYKAIAR